MSRYKASVTVHAPADKVFAFVSNVNNLPKYLPTTKHAKAEGEDRVRVQGTAGGHKYDQDGNFHVDAAKHSMKWSSDGNEKYSGHLEVVPQGDNSEVTVHLVFDPPEKVKEEMASRAGSHDAAIQEGLEAAMQSILDAVEGTGGKTEPASTQTGAHKPAAHKTEHKTEHKA